MARRATAAESIPPHLHIIPELPSMITAVDGRNHSVIGDIWILPESVETTALVKLNWTLLTYIVLAGASIPVMSQRAVSLIKLYIMERMSAVRGALKPNSAKNILFAMAHFAHWLVAHPEWLPAGRGFDWGDLTEDMFDAWLSVEYGMKRKGNSAKQLRSFYLWGVDPDAVRPDFSPALALILRAKRIKLSPTGEVVESRDPRLGPFTREELDLITRACEAGAGTDHDRAIAWTLRQTAIRPRQLYKLRNRDLEVLGASEDEGGLCDGLKRVAYQLRVRKIKQRNNAIKYHFLPLSEGCARLLLDLRRPESGPDEPLFWWVSSSYRDHVRYSLRAFSKDADLRTPRLPIKNPKLGGPIHERMHLTARRFRYGVATDRVSQGESLENVAAMLGHKGTENVHVYVETSSLIADDFQRATDYAIARLIDLMEGRAHQSEVNLLAGPITPVSPKLAPYIGAPSFHKAQDQGSLQKKQSKFTEVAILLAPDPAKSMVRIEELVGRARRRFRLIYPGQDFDEQLWDVTHLRERPNTTGVAHFGFTTLESTARMRLSTRNEDALPAHFADVIKSWMVSENNVSLWFNTKRLYAARYFWSYLSTRHGPDTQPFIWSELTEDDMLAFEQFLISHRTARCEPLKPGSIVLIINHIQWLIDFLSVRGICRQIHYLPQSTPAGYPTHQRISDKELAAELKLPAPGVLEALGSIYYRLTAAPAGEMSDWVLIVISAVAILILTGLRIGELVTLPYDCEVEDKQPKVQAGESYLCRYGIRYWVEKTRKKTMRIKWISPTAEPIVRACITRIKCLTAATRERARILESDPTKVTLPPEIATRTILTRSELFALLGWSGRGYVKSQLPELLPQHGTGRNLYFYVKDLEAYLLSIRDPFLYTIYHDDGTVQKLSESLLIIFAKQSRCRQMNACRLVVEPVKADTIKRYLTSRNNLFKTYGSTEEQKGLTVNPHSLRHWLIHIAYMGGMEMRLILRYFAKRYASGVADYLHFSTDESDTYAPEALKTQRFYVPV